MLTDRSWRLSDVAEVPSVCSDSDHRLFQADVRLDHKLKKNICHSSKSGNYVVFDDTLLEEFFLDMTRLLFRNRRKTPECCCEDWKPVLTEHWSIVEHS